MKWQVILETNQQKSLSKDDRTWMMSSVWTLVMMKLMILFMMMRVEKVVRGNDRIGNKNLNKESHLEACRSAVLRLFILIYVSYLLRPFIIFCRESHCLADCLTSSCLFLIYWSSEFSSGFWTNHDKSSQLIRYHNRLSDCIADLERVGVFKIWRPAKNDMGMFVSGKCWKCLGLILIASEGICSKYPLSYRKALNLWMHGL